MIFTIFILNIKFFEQQALPNTATFVLCNRSCSFYTLEVSQTGHLYILITFDNYTAFPIKFDYVNKVKNIVLIDFTSEIYVKELVRNCFCFLATFILHWKQEIPNTYQ